MISWFGHGERLGNCTVQHVVDTFIITDWDFDKTRGVYRHAFSNILPLESSLHVSCDILVKAIQEARDGMPIPAGNIHMDTWRWAPAGVVEDTIWWSGASRYYGGRAPMARMAELPDDSLRCICEQLVPPRSNEESMAAAQAYCDCPVPLTVRGTQARARRAHDRRDDLGTRRGRFERRVIRV